MRTGRRRAWAPIALTGIALCALLGAALLVREPPPPSHGSGLWMPSGKGLNYGFPRTQNDKWVGGQWLRSETGREDHWLEVRPAIDADLAFITQHRLGRLVRVIIGLDQMMVWDPNLGYVRFHEPSMRNFAETLDLFDARGVKMIAVLYDQEEVRNLGNFHFEALDGRHAAMRENYLRATKEFLRRFGGRPTVVAWDLFNEAYNSLGRDGGLPNPPAENPISPNYPAAVVHQWLRDLYRAAKSAAPDAWFTASDTTALYSQAPNPGKYDGALDFYDIHIYDDHPRYPDWKRTLAKPYIVGEAGASTVGDQLANQSLNAPAMSYLLKHAEAAGVGAVLLQSIEGHIIFSARRDALTPTGMALATLGGDQERLARSPAQVPHTLAQRALANTVRTLRDWFKGGKPPHEADKAP